MPTTYELSKIITPDGKTVFLKDTVAREMATGGTKYIGKLYVNGTTYTHLTDGDTRTSVEIVDSTSTGHHTYPTAPATLNAGDIVLDDEITGRKIVWIQEDKVKDLFNDEINIRINPT